MRGLVLALGLLIRLALIALLPASSDVINFERSAAIFAHGGNIYTEQFYWNYAPLIGLPLALVYRVPLPFGTVWRVFLSLISLANCVLVSRLNRRQGVLVFMLCWLNPALILFDAFAGQFENLAVLPLLIAVNYAQT